MLPFYGIAKGMSSVSSWLSTAGGGGFGAGPNASVLEKNRLVLK